MVSHITRTLSYMWLAKLSMWKHLGIWLHLRENQIILLFIQVCCASCVLSSGRCHFTAALKRGMLAGREMPTKCQPTMSVDGCASNYVAKGVTHLINIQMWYSVAAPRHYAPNTTEANEVANREKLWGNRSWVLRFTTECTAYHMTALKFRVMESTDKGVEMLKPQLLA